jgi:glycosyltransferase involved in cell wall biosynthesis
MHIVFVTDDYPPSIGGMATHAAELSRALAEAGPRVTVLTASELLRGASRLRFRDGVRVTGNLRRVQLGAVGIRRLAQARYRTRRFLRSLARQDTGSTVVHVHEIEAPRRYRPMTSLPMVWTNHSSMFLQAYDRDERAALSSIVESCDWITAPSRELADKVATLGYPASRITYVPNGVDVATFAPPATSRRRDRCVFIAARRFAWKNGLHVLLDAIALLPAELQGRVGFLLAGDVGQQDEYAASLRGRIDALIRSGWDVQNLGAIPNAEMRRHYAGSDVALLPSLMEATSIAGLEAMACGLPLLGTNVGGIPEIVEPMRTGVLCEPGDARALADAIRMLALDPELRAQLGAAGRERAVRDFSWPTLARRYIEVYEQCFTAGPYRGAEGPATLATLGR